MRSVLLLASSLGLLAAASDPKPFDCGTNTEHASEDFLKKIQALHDKSQSGSPAARAALAARDAAATGPINVDAVFHIVATSAAKSSITNDMPSAQLTALNTAYKPYNIQFNLINVTWTTNDTWAIGANTADDLAMKQNLRQGSYDTLNLYFQTDLSGGVLGRCTLLSSIANGKSDPTVYANDGCNINAHTMPMGTLNGYNSGMTAVHETGHWMGLLHTFEGYSCTGPGDYIDDTPQESTATDGLPLWGKPNANMTNSASPKSHQKTTSKVQPLPPSHTPEKKKAKAKEPSVLRYTLNLLKARPPHNYVECECDNSSQRDPPPPYEP
ncbi:Peptidase-M43 domain containing protein [Pyrenophora tritici-repentis]|nr:Peptidase-M43 domain containing protein [Pyrenophora tritici-repentis]